MSGWNGLLAPAGTPEAIVTRINNEVLRVLKHPDVIKRLAVSGYLPAPDNTPAQFGDFVKREIDKYTKLVRESGTRVK